MKIVITILYLISFKKKLKALGKCFRVNNKIIKLYSIKEG